MKNGPMESVSVNRKRHAFNILDLAFEMPQALGQLVESYDPYLAVCDAKAVVGASGNRVLLDASKLSYAGDAPKEKGIQDVGLLES